MAPSLFVPTLPTGPRARWGLGLSAGIHLGPVISAVLLTWLSQGCRTCEPPPRCPTGEDCTIRMVFTRAASAVREAGHSRAPAPPRPQRTDVHVSDFLTLTPLNTSADMPDALRALGGAFGLSAATSDGSCGALRRMVSVDGRPLPDDPVSCNPFFAVRVHDEDLRQRFGAQADEDLLALFPRTVETAIHGAIVEAASQLSHAPVQVLGASYRFDPVMGFAPVVPASSLVLATLDKS